MNKIEKNFQLLVSEARWTDLVECCDACVHDGLEIILALKYKALGLVYLNQLNQLETVMTEVEKSTVDIDFLLTIGAKLLELKEFRMANRYFEKLLKTDRTNYAAQINSGICHVELGAAAKAESAFLNAMEAQPRRFEAYLYAGMIAGEKGDVETAIKRLFLAVTYAGSEFEPSFQLARYLAVAGRYKEAIEQLDFAYKINPKSQKLLFLLGNLLIDTNQKRSALKVIERLKIGMGMQDESLDVLHLKTLMGVCQWEEAYFQLKEWLSKTDALEKPREFGALHLLALFDDPALHKNILDDSEMPEVQRKKLADPTSPSLISKNKTRKYQLLFISGDMRKHAMGYLLEGFFSSIDRSLFELHLLNTTAEKDSHSERLFSLFDEIKEIVSWPDRQLEEFLNDMQPDLIVDLMGRTGVGRQNRFEVLKSLDLKVVNYLGHPGTAGYKNNKFLIADDIVIPDGSEHYYSEQVIRLNGCYQVNYYDFDNITKIEKEALGIDANDFAFCCFNQHYKFNPETINAWAKILQSIKKSKLYLLNGEGNDGLKEMWKRCGLNLERLIFLPTLSRAEHLKRLGAFDLVLDSFPYNAHTTAADALANDVPVLTMCGQSFASRVGASLNASVGLSKLTASSWADYITLAQDIAQNKESHRYLKSHLITRKKESDLFDYRRKTKLLEDAFIRVINCD